jgi:hypothetical protein
VNPQSKQTKQTSITVLHWTTGLIVLLESWLTLRMSWAGVQAGGAHAPLLRVALALSSLEIVAAVLFLVPRTLAAGGYGLLAIFALAVAIHVLHGDLRMEQVVLYAAAVWVVLNYRGGVEESGGQ